VSESARKLLSTALQTAANTDPEMDGAVLIGWIAVAEWMAPDGSRWLSRVHGLGNGDDCPTWTQQGYLHHALHDGDTFGRDDNHLEDDDVQ
jgi:hypothetical protein